MLSLQNIFLGVFRKTISIFCYSFRTNIYLYGSNNKNRLHGNYQPHKGALGDAHKTNRWLAEQLGKDQTTVSKWCSNKTQPTLETLMQIAKCLDIDVKDLLVSSKIS